MIRKRTLFILIAFVLLLSNIPALAADVNEIDYKDYVRIVRENYRAKYGEIFNTPTPIFKAVINGETYTVMPFYKPFKAGEEQIRDATVYTDSSLIEPHITVPVGTEIVLEDISIGGDGKSITMRDWQYYKRDINYREYDRFVEKTTDKNITIKADREGYINVFLNVTDGLKFNVSDNWVYENWSDKGNWRDNRMNPFDFLGQNVRGWYFTVLKIKVEKQEPDFEIKAIQSEVNDINLDTISSVDLNFTVDLKYTDEEIDTVVDLYKNDQLIDSKNISVKGNESVDVNFTIMKEQLNEGTNNFYAVVNADYNLEKAKPYEDEVILNNNKAMVVVYALVTPQPIEPPYLPPPVTVWDEPRSLNVAIKWDKVPLQIGKTSPITSKIKRDSSNYTWSRYEIYVTENFQGDIRREIKVKDVGYNKDFMLKKGSNWFDLEHGGKAKYTVPSNGKPGTELITKIKAWTRIDNSNIPTIPPRPPKPTPPPGPPSPPDEDDPDSAWSSYYRELDDYEREYEEYLEKLEIWKMKIADIEKLESVHYTYFSVVEDKNPKRIPATGYNFAQYKAYHDSYNSFIDRHLKRYVSIEGDSKRLIWFTKADKLGQAESKNVIVHKPANPKKGGLDPGIIVNPPKPPKSKK